MAEAISTQARQIFAMVMGPGQQCLDITALEKRLVEGGVPFTNGPLATHEPIGRGYAKPHPTQQKDN